MGRLNVAREGSSWTTTHRAKRRREAEIGRGIIDYVSSGARTPTAHPPIAVYTPGRVG